MCNIKDLERLNQGYVLDRFSHNSKAVISMPVKHTICEICGRDATGEKLVAFIVGTKVIGQQCFHCYSSDNFDDVA